MSDERDSKVTEVSGDIWGNIQPKEYSIKVKLDKAVLNTIKIKSGENLIGRMPENDIMIDDPEVSRSHANIKYDDEKGILSVEDMQSENGILVNGKKTKSSVLKVGDNITVGNHVLSVILADEQSYKPSVAQQIEKSQAQTWRLDQTVAAASPMAQEQMADTVKTQATKKISDPYGTAAVSSPEEQEKIKRRMSEPKTNKVIDLPPDKLSLNIEVGGVRIGREIAYDFVRDIDPKREKNLEDAVYINVKIGNKIFGKKIKF